MVGAMSIGIEATGIIGATTSTEALARENEQIEVRELTVGDATDFVRFMVEMASETNFLLQTPGEVNRDVEKQIRMIKSFGDHRNVFIARSNGKIIGFIGLTRFGMSKMSHVANFAMGVLRSHRNRGIASGLMAEGEKWLRSVGVHRVEMTVAVSNLGAISFYRKLGFREEGRRVASLNLDEELQDELYMAKILD
jgi:ribosomal protein S18 acetylase RimI-like enzyme